jgi:hypothetical protein
LRPGVKDDKETTMAKGKPNKIFIEPRDNGFAAIRQGNEKASFIEPTQRAAEIRARKMDPDAGIDVSRVRHTSKGGPDQWRKADH